eukprot:TRINITY_DN29309_c0_g1_i1.p1 TRINITY_DN29309_c0_g1~~TRINITY_DN29309_c0_g1_i1.p1  ORF type:complete len:278 (+),score=54.96 TRINITY_DN29309_c0_g1_i1:70-834(+)
MTTSSDDQPAAAETPGWPLRKLFTALSTLQPADVDKRKCVLLSTGSLNPVHLGHVDMFERARAHLMQEHGMVVLAGWLSPSHGDYVGAKMDRMRAQGCSSAFHIDPSLRCDAVAAATRESPWLDVGRWESSQPPPWQDFPQVCTALHKALQSQEALRSVELLYLCGADHLRCCPYGVRGPGESVFRVVVAPRAGQQVQPRGPEKVIVIPPAASEHISHASSTKVRERMAGGQPLTELVHPEVEQLLSERWKQDT